MKLIKLILWLVVTLIIAYFLTDLKIGEKSLKQTIDGQLNRFWPGLVEKKESLTQEPPKEEITENDAKKLNNLFEKNK